MRAVFAGGGSAGHLFPSLAVAQRFMRLAPEAEALFLGARRDLDAQLLADRPHKLLHAVGLPYGFSARTLWALGKIAWGSLEAFSVIRRFRPHVFLGTGGYVTAASALAAHGLKTPCVLHVSDALPDRTNLRLAKIAKLITVAFEAAAKYFPPHKVVITGQPVREEILQGDRATARAQLGYEAHDFVLLVTGGSQGARRLNDALIEALPHLLATGIKIFHQTGRLDYERVRAAVATLKPGPNYRCEAFISQMHLVLAAADLYVLRAGSSSLAEAAAWGLPMIVVPGAFAHGHQKHNAEALVQRGAAIMIEDEQLTGECLTAAIRALVADEARRQAMSHAALGWGSRQAAERIAELIIAAASDSC